MRRLFSVLIVALVSATSTTYAQQADMSEAVAKCILQNLHKAHTEGAVTVLIRACEVLNKEQS